MTGKDLIVILSRGGVALASTRIKSHDIKTQCSTIETASGTQQDWEECVAGRKSWTLSVNYLVLAASQVRDLLYIGQTFDITVKDSGNNSSVTGHAIMTGVGGSGGVGTLARGSFSLRGNGSLT